jgi:hypothetical protein
MLYGTPIVELARQVRAETLRLLAAAPEAWLTWALDGTSNHLLWHAAHALWLQDVLFVELVTGRSELPEGWAESFGMDCRPVALTNQLGLWPRREDVARRLAEQLSRILALIDELPAERLSSGAGAANRRSLLASLIHAWHDEAKHQGEMYLLLKLRRAVGQASSLP